MPTRASTNLFYQRSSRIVVSMAPMVYYSEPPRLISNIGKHLERCCVSLEEADAVAVKLHMGEEGNARYIRPNIVRAVVDWLKERGVEPFVTDSTTLYRRRRHTLFDYLRTAAAHGFTSESLGCPVLIADGIKSTGVAVEVESPVKLRKVPVSGLIYEADALVCLSHVTLHPDVLPAGSLKNVAMGCTTKEAKMRMHASDAKPIFDVEKCVGCGTCVRHCPAGALELRNGKVFFTPERCVSCAECIAFCSFGAVKVNWDALSKDVCRGVVDAAKAVLSTFAHGKAAFLNLGYDITAECDCGGDSRLPVVTDFGLLSSQDPVAVDRASVDMVNTQPAYPGGEFSKLSESPDRMSSYKPSVNWAEFLSLASDAGLGETTYELVKI